MRRLSRCLNYHAPFLAVDKALILDALPAPCAKPPVWLQQSTDIGSITIDGATYPHDVVIRLSGEVLKRKKRLSKQYYGTSHTISVDEAEFVYEKGCNTLVLGTGQYGNVHLSPEAAEFFTNHDCRVVLQPTPQAIKAYNKAKGRAIGLFHVTC